MSISAHSMIGTPDGLKVAVTTDNASGDAFGRLRVANPATIFDSKQTHDNAPLFWDESLETGAGITAAHVVDESATTITSTLNTAGKFTRQTYQRFNYQPGKSNFILMTGIISQSGGGTGVVRRIGQFDDKNGVFFEDDEGTMKVVVRSHVTGSPVDTKVAQADWNGDPMDGTGPSGITVDWSKTHIFMFDYEWLGVGRVRFGVNIDGATYVVHSSHHANVLTDVYMSTPNNPLRYQMETTSSSPASKMKHICVSVMSEGGIEKVGALHSHSMGAIHLDADAADTIYAAIGIRLKTTHIGATVDIIGASLLAETNDDFEWMILLNPVVAGSPVFVDHVSGSALQMYNGVTANTIADIDIGTSLLGGWIAAQQTNTLEIQNARRLGAAIDGTRDEIVLAVRPLSSNADIHAAINWRELS